MTSLNFNQVIQGYPSYRVFIFGFEVTADCPDISSQWTTFTRAPSSATISLLNLNDKYVYRRDDLVYQNSDSLAKFANNVNSDIADIYNTIVTNGEIVVNGLSDLSSTKSKITTLKQNDAYFVDVSPIDPFTGIAQPTMSSPIYPIIEGRSCFHQNDPVRIFAQDPFDPAVWYYFFSGFITQISDITSGTNLEKTLAIQCEDVSKSLRYARYSFNPGFRDPSQINTIKDLSAFTGYASPLVGKNFQEAADYVVFGDLVTDEPPDSALVPVPVVDPTTGATFNKLVLKTGAGNFQPLTLTDRVFTITQSSNPGRSITTLVDWQNDILNMAVSVDDITDLRTRSDNPVTATTVIRNLQTQRDEARNSGNFAVDMTQLIITAIGSDPINYPVDGGTLYMLLPEGLSQLGTQVVSQDFVSSISMVSEFKDRRSLMYDLVDRVEFVFYADPKGNLVVEFPLFDFDPDAFNPPNLANAITPASDNVVPPSVKFTSVGSDGSVTFDNERRFTIEDDAVDDFVATDDDAPVKTICLTVPAVSRYSNATVGNELQSSVRSAKAVRLDSLIPIYGPRFIQADPRKIVETDRGALIASAIELNKCLGHAYTLKINMLPRFSAWLNRPMLFRHRNCIGTARSIVHRIAWTSNIQTTISLDYTRGWSGDMDQQTGKMIYTPIGGNASRAINYAVLFAQNKVPNTTVPATSSGRGSQNP